MNKESASNIDLEDVALELLTQLRKVMPQEDERFTLDEMDATQSPGMTIELLKEYAIQYRPQLNQEYKNIILNEFGYTF
ncbi:MAG: hypothetical protein SOR40_06610 [Rothia sp. (in: high G+C Gram-positive bacteria)]|nr:hypothetical protein [Rothia sp. (in: high G+C Gram-positive bacteria)]